MKTITHAEFREACAAATKFGLEAGLRKLGIEVGPCELTPAESAAEMTRLYHEAKEPNR